MVHFQGVIWKWWRLHGKGDFSYIHNHVWSLCSYLLLVVTQLIKLIVTGHKLC